MGVTIEHYRARIGCHNIKNTCTSIQDNESPFLSGRLFNKGLMLFHSYVFLPWWLCYYYLAGCRSNSHSVDYNTFSHCRWYSIPTSANMFLSIPRMAPRWLYMVTLFLLELTQLSSQLSTKICTIKYFQSAIYTMKIAQRLLYSVLLHRRHLYRASN